MSTSRQRAQGHTRPAHYCSCGYVLHGNGAKFVHHAKHERANDGHRWWTTTQWYEHGSPFLNRPIRGMRRPLNKDTAE